MSVARPLPIIIGVVVTVNALACSLIGVVLYFATRKQNSINSIEKKMVLKGVGAIPADYTSINSIQQRMASARANDDYLNMPNGKPEGHYNHPSDILSPDEGAHYDQVSIGQLNAEADLRIKAHYSSPLDIVATIEGAQYDQVSLTQLNKEMDQLDQSLRAEHNLAIIS